MSRSDDHVFPDSCFPDSTPETVQRWTAPSHRKCNIELGAVEKSLFLRLAMCADSPKIEASGVSKKALRSLDPTAPGLSARERAHRWAQSEKLWRDVTQLDSTTPTVFSAWPNATMGVEASWDDFYDVAGVQIRRREDRRNPYALLIKLVRDKRLPEEIESFWAVTIPISLGPGFEIWRVACEDDPLVVTYRINIWDALRGC